MMANPGALYPLILGEFQWGILNKCQYNTASTRQVQFVKGPEKPWDYEDFIKDFSIKTDELFPGSDNEDFRNTVYKTIADEKMKEVFSFEKDVG